MKSAVAASQPCVTCGSHFWPSRVGAMYCSGYCGQRAFRAKQPPKTSACGICGRQFVRDGSRFDYCTPACARTAELRRLQARNSGEGKGWAAGTERVPRRACEMCGTAFYAPPVLVKRGGGRFCSNACRTKNIALNPKAYPQVATRRAKTGKREDLGGLFVRSAWEANYARYLNLLQQNGLIARWEYEPDTFEFTTIKRGSRFYTPDFKVFAFDGSHEYHEVKGYMDERSATKLKRMAKFYPGERVVLIDRAAYKALRARVGWAIEHWEGA